MNEPALNTFDKSEANKRTISGKYSILKEVEVDLININTLISNNFDTFPDLISLIKSDLKPLNPDSALKYAYREVTNGVKYKFFQELGVDKITNLPYGLFNGMKIKSSGLAAIIRIIRQIKNKI